MNNFISHHAHGRVAAINVSADQKFTVEKEDYIVKEKDRIAQDINDILRKNKVNLRFEGSKLDNSQRIWNIKKIDILIQKLYKEALI